jgi:hypothetical protein
MDAFDRSSTHDMLGEDIDEDGHGTCMVSIAGGLYSGVQKRANLIPVRVMKKRGENTDMAGITWALAAIEENIAQKGMRDRSVISISWAIEPAKLIPAPEWDPRSDPLRSLFIRLENAGAVIVMAAGNNAMDPPPRNAIDYYTPQRLGGDLGRRIVVGAASWTAPRETSSHVETLGRNILTLLGPYYGICASHTGSIDNFKESRGTSVATAAVAGLAAYYMGNRGCTSETVKDELLGIARQKKGTFANGIPRAANDLEVPCPGDPDPATLGYVTRWERVLLEGGVGRINPPRLFKVEGSANLVSGGLLRCCLRTAWIPALLLVVSSANITPLAWL